MRACLIATAALALATPLAAQQEGPTLSVGISEEYGRYVAGPGGRPVYIFATDVRGGDELYPLASCRDRCLEDWPPLLAPDEGPITVGAGIPPDQVTVIDWEGEQFITYDGRPLFFFAMEDGDLEPDGHGVHTYGGWWILIEPEGDVKETGIIPDVDD